jgi:Tfp pilus assembly protein PilF
MWDRGEHQVALRLATLVEAKGGHYLATLVLARQLDSQGLKQDALVKYEEASTRGASATELWSEFGAVLEEAGRWVEAMGIYRQSYPGPGVPEAMSRLLVRILAGRGRRDAVDCYRVWLELAAQDPAAGAHILQQVVTRLVDMSWRRRDATSKSWPPGWTA